jgi:hypothetical protein
MDNLFSVEIENKEKLIELSHLFSKQGFIKVTDFFTPELKQSVTKEADFLLNKHSERRDLHLATTNFTPRYMSVVQSELIRENSNLICSIYGNEKLQSVLEFIAREKMMPCPSKDEEFLISRHEKKGDTHGWHWGDYSFALIWVLKTPDIEHGGLLQCVPHTSWNKENPRINHYLSTNQIDTYSFVSGDIYLLRTDTTLHRTIPLNIDAERVMLNMTWGNSKAVDLTELETDRWWEDETVADAKQVNEMV